MRKLYTRHTEEIKIKRIIEIEHVVRDVNNPTIQSTEREREADIENEPEKLKKLRTAGIKSVIEKINEPFSATLGCQVGVNPEFKELEKNDSQELQPNIDFYVHENSIYDPNLSRKDSRTYSETKFIRRQSLE